MPGPAIHHIVAAEVAKSLTTKLGPAYTDFLNRIQNEYSPAYYLGAQGPDFLFFNTKDIHPKVKELVDYYLEAADFIEDLKKKISDIIPQPLKDAVAAIETAADRSAVIDRIRDLLTQVQNTISLLTDIITVKIETFITSKVNLFDILKNPIQDAQPHNEWWWFDTLHYRRTGKYAQTLLKMSDNFSMEHAYALGYLTHIAADTVGHPFVNIISGGPYRTHAKRHKLVENHHDVWAYNKYFGGEFIQSKLGEKYIINGDHKHLPDSLNALILNSIKKVYFGPNGSKYGSAMTKDDLNDAYRLWLYWFRKVTNALDLPKPQPYSFSAEIAEVWEQFTDNIGDLADTIGGGMSGDGGILGVLKAIAAAILAPFLVAAAAVDFLLGIITTASVSVIQFFISLIYEELYNAYLNLHQALVLNAFAFPFNYQLSNYLVQHLYDSSSFDMFHHNAKSLHAYYPTKKFSIGGMECESHLIYPFPGNAWIEKDIANGAPMSYYKADVNRYIFGPLQLNIDGYLNLKQFVEKSPGDNETTTRMKFTWLRYATQKIELGSAIDFSTFLYDEHIKNKDLPDFNLDGDKGIGFKTWRKVKSYADVNNPAASDYPVGDAVPDINTDIIQPSEEIL